MLRRYAHQPARIAPQTAATTGTPVQQTPDTAFHHPALPWRSGPSATERPADYQPCAGNAAEARRRPGWDSAL